MLNPMEFGGFVIRRFALGLGGFAIRRFALGLGGFAIRRFAIPYFLTLNL